jgi:hypothetical protein
VAVEIKEPGTFSGTKFDDVMPVPKGTALLAARFCNIPTNKAAPLMSHLNWLDAHVQPLVRSLHGPWVDLIGYASRLGQARYNYWLSAQRVQKFREWIDNYANIKFNLQSPKGASVSATDPTNNDGWWRSVEVFVYGFKPPTATPMTVVGSTKFKIRCLGTGSAAVSKWGVGGTVFEIVDKEASESAIFVHGGGSINFSLPNLPDYSFADTGPWTDFQTSARAELYDFVGSATIDQDPGFQAGSLSYGSMRFKIDSSRLFTLGARIMPSMILAIETGSGVSFGMGIGLPGPFRMIGTTHPQ